LSTFFFQIRPPAQRPCAPIRVRLGKLSRRDAQQAAAWLSVIALSAFTERRRQMDGSGEDQAELAGARFLLGDTPEVFLDKIKATLENFATKLVKPAVLPTSPAALRGIAAFQEAVSIEQEVRKGAAGHPTVVGRAEMLRNDVWNRWRAGGGLGAGRADNRASLGAFR
jgi:hypothetical protein